MNPLRKKLVIIGDSDSGKTSLLIRFITQEFPDGYIPPMIDNVVADVTVKSRRVEFLLVECPTGFDALDRLSRLAFSEVDVVLMCFSVVSVESFEKIPTSWARVLAYYFRDVPVVLVGTKKDLRGDFETVTNLMENNQKPISKKMGNDMAVNTCAYGYVECSAKTNEGVENVFMIAAMATMKRLKRRSSIFNPTGESEVLKRHSLR